MKSASKWRSEGPTPSEQQLPPTGAAGTKGPNTMVFFSLASHCNREGMEFQVYGEKAISYKGSLSINMMLEIEKSDTGSLFMKSWIYFNIQMLSISC